MGADIKVDGPPISDTNGGEGEIGGSHSGGIMDSRWSNMFDLSGGCSSPTGYLAACHGVSSPDEYMAGKMRGWFGDSWYDLPGNNNEIARAESIYADMVQRTMAAYNSSHKDKKKPKLKPQPKKRPSKKEVERRRKRNAGVGNDEEEMQNPQEPVLNNPTTLPAEDGSPSCALSVSFQPGTSYGGDPNKANGPTIINWNGGPNAGLGFTVTGSVTGGGSIGADFNPNGWALEQYVANYEVYNGRERPDPEFGTRGHQEPLSRAPHHISGNTFSWWDHPGIPTQNLSSYFRKSNFAVKVINGNQQCEVRFAVQMSFSNGNWSIGWGAGAFR